MSGPVFVIDVQGQPLMPIAEAHARKLLSSGKARRWPHPTLTILQLTRTVEMPILRPVLLGVAVHQNVAELFVVADGSQTTFSLLSIVVDLGHLRVQWWRHPGRRRPRQRNHTQTTIRAVGSVIGTLWSWLPLSHIVMLRTAVVPRQRPRLMRRLRQYLSVSGLRVAVAPPDATTPAGIPHDLYTALIALAANPAHYAPVIIADAIKPFTATRLTRFVEDGAAETPLSGIAVVGIPPMSGVISLDGGDDPVVLHVALAADATGVISRYARVPPNAPFQRWPLSRVAFAPLLPRSAHASVALYDDALTAYIESEEAQ